MELVLEGVIALIMLVLSKNRVTEHSHFHPSVLCTQHR